MRYWVALIIFFFMTAVVVSQTAHAASGNQGLLVAPIKQELSINSGTTQSGYIVVGDLTTKPMTVNLSIKQFSITNSGYALNFGPLKNDWIRLQKSEVQLNPGQSEKINYDIVAPLGAKSGGYYFAIMVQTNVRQSSFNSTIKIVSQLYLTLNGKLVRTSIIKNPIVPLIVMGNQLNYSYDAEDTGNIYFDAIFFGQLKGIFGQQSEPDVSHILVPGLPRNMTSQLTLPFWPGIYKLTYGLKTNFEPNVLSESSYIIYIPPWSIVALVLVVLIAKYAWQLRHTK